MFAQTNTFFSVLYRHARCDTFKHLNVDLNSGIYCWGTFITSENKIRGFSGRAVVFATLCRYNQYKGQWFQKEITMNNFPVAVKVRSS